MKLKLTNALQLDEHGNTSPAHLAIDDGRIAQISAQDFTFDADEVIDAKQAYVLPGLVDLNVSLREPGASVKGSIYSETKAAAAGGVTTLCCTPDTDPVNDSAAVTKLIEERAQQSRYCRVLPIGALTQGLAGERLAAYGALKAAGCIALGNGYSPIRDLAITKRCFEYATSHTMPVFINPIEPALCQGVVHEGMVSTNLGLPGIPSVGEAIAVSNLIMLAELTGVSLHFNQISAAASVDLIARAKRAGLSLTASVATHNLLYSERDLSYFDGHYHCMPPIRAEQDRLALLEGVRSGVIDAITSSHQPHEAAAKQMPFAETAPGISGVELLLPMGLLLEQMGDLPFVSYLKALTVGASSVIDPTALGLVQGGRADLCLFDPHPEWQLSADNLLSRGKNSPLIGVKLKGKVQATLFDGVLSYRAA